MLLFSFDGLLSFRIDDDKLLELLFQLPPRIPRFDEPLIPIPLPIITEKQEIVQVANVTFHSQVVLHEVVESVQINIRQELARQISNRQSTIVEPNIEQVAAGGPLLPHTVVMSVQHLLDQRQQTIVGDDPTDQGHQDPMVHAGKYFCTSHLRAESNCRANSKARRIAACVPSSGRQAKRILDEPPLENWLNDSNNCVVHHSVSKRRGRPITYFKTILRTTQARGGITISSCLNTRLPSYRAVFTLATWSCATQPGRGESMARRGMLS